MCTLSLDGETDADWGWSADTEARPGGASVSHTIRTRCGEIAVGRSRGEESVKTPVGKLSSSLGQRGRSRPEDHRWRC